MNNHWNITLFCVKTHLATFWVKTIWVGSIYAQRRNGLCYIMLNVFDVKLESNVVIEKTSWLVSCVCSQSMCSLLIFYPISAWGELLWGDPLYGYFHLSVQIFCTRGKRMEVGSCLSSVFQPPYMSWSSSQVCRRNREQQKAAAHILPKNTEKWHKTLKCFFFF